MFLILVVWEMVCIAAMAIAMSKSLFSTLVVSNRDF